MTTKTLGTAAQTTLIAVQFQYGGILPADLAAIQTHILDDQITPQRIFQGAFTPGSGQLFIPNRGFLKMLPGDYVGYDAATGWPILVSAKAAAAAGWVHT